MRRSFLFFLVAFICLIKQMDAQTFFRLNADFSIREIVVYEYSDSTRSYLTRGELDYDKNKRQIAYDISFPKEENWILQDSVFYKIKNDTIHDRYTLPFAMQMLNFDIILNEYNYDFLLKKMGCQVVDVKKEKNYIYKKWKYPSVSSLDYFTHLLTQEKKGRTTAIAYLDEENIVSRQYYKNFKNIDGLNVPHLIEQRVYSDSSTYVKKLILKDVSLNSMERDNVFRNDLEFLPFKPGADKGNIRERLGVSEE